MTIIQIQQLQTGYGELKRSLFFMAEENANHKIRLAKFLNEKTLPVMLPEIENFQNRFIREDEKINFLKALMKQLEKEAVNENAGDDLKSIEFRERFAQLNAEIQSAEKEFDLLRIEFNNFLGNYA